VNILPTHHCFDDVLEFFPEGRPQDEPLESFTVVHGILLMPDGEPYVHAWLENATDVIQGGLFEGERIWFAMSIEDFRASRRIIDETRYTPLEALAENYRTGHFGPWVPAYRDLALFANGSREVWVDSYARMEDARVKEQKG
jgi:hypothetical protein